MCEEFHIIVSHLLAILHTQKRPIVQTLVFPLLLPVFAQHRFCPMGPCPQCEHTADGVVTKQRGKCLKAAVEEELEQRKAAIGESIQKLQDSKNRIKAAPKRSISDLVPLTKNINSSEDGVVAEPVPRSQYQGE